jgi:hypothetical protein
MRFDRSLRVRTKWEAGPAVDSQGPFFISYTEFTPRKARDVVAIYLAARQLVAACAKLDGSVGVTTYWRLQQWRGGSLSVWENPEALRQFVRLPFHVEIMRKYRNRGSVRSTDWWSDCFDLTQALADGQRTLDRA